MTVRVHSSCPVCARPDDAAPTCPGCGWVLRAGPWPGPVTAEHRRAHRDRLAAAVRHHDLAALVRAARVGGAGLDRLARATRGGALDDGERAATVAETAGSATAPGPGALDEAVERTAVRGGTLLVVDAGPEGLALGRLARDGASGRTRLLAPVHHEPWPALLTGAPDDAAVLRYLLAGGVGAGNAALRPERDLAADGVLDALLPGAADRDEAVLVVARTAGWPVPEGLHARVAERLARPGRRPEVLDRPAEEPGLSDATVAAALARAPLPWDVGLVAAAVDPADWTVRTVVVPVFPAGTRPGRDVRRTVRATAAGAGAAVATVLVRLDPPAGPVDLAAAEVLERGALRLPDGPASLGVRLPSAAAPVVDGAQEDPRGWPGLLGDLPARRPPTGAVDLAVTVELGGDDALVERRLEDLRAVVKELGAWRDDAEEVRVAVVGYRDHRYAGTGRDPVVEACAPGSPDDALAFAATLTAGPVREPAAAPLEDALRRVAALDRTPGAQRAVLIVGSRPPHPQGQHRVAACPNGVHLSRVLAHLDAGGVRRGAVWDRPASYREGTKDATTAQAVWARLAEAGRHRPGTDPGDVLRSLGVPRRPPVPPAVALPLVVPDGDHIVASSFSETP